MKVSHRPLNSSVFLGMLTQPTESTGVLSTRSRSLWKGVYSKRWREPQPTLPTFQLGNPRSSTTSSALAQTHSYQCIVVCDNAAMAPAQRTQRSCNRYESFKPNFWQVTEYRVPSNNTYATPQTRGAPAPVPHLRCARAQPPSA